MLAPAHAKNRAPSSAKRWLSCPYSALITPMYPHDPTEASLKGDAWHKLMEIKLEFGTLPTSADCDAVDAMDDLHKYVKERRAEMGKGTQLFVEQRLDIPETGEFGTADIILVSDKEIEIIDEKSGYVSVEVRMNAQLLTYLLGAIALHGERKKYRLTIHQPNYDHIDGPLRHFEPTDEDIAWLRNEIKYSMEHEDKVVAGKHCKETFCPHRGTCEAFNDYVRKDLILGWHATEVRSISDDMLASALDASDELGGWRNELRSEAMRRIMNMDRAINGYKVVKGRKQRSILHPRQLVDSFKEYLGMEWAVRLFPSLDWLSQDAIAAAIDSANILKNIGTAKHVEDVIRQYARHHQFPKGGWKNAYAIVAAPYIRETADGFSLEKAIDGRPAHKRGSEFGPLLSLDPDNKVTNIV